MTAQISPTLLPTRYHPRSDTAQVASDPFLTVVNPTYFLFRHLSSSFFWVFKFTDTTIKHPRRIRIRNSFFPFSVLRFTFSYFVYISPGIGQLIFLAYVLKDTTDIYFRFNFQFSISHFLSFAFVPSSRVK